MFRRGDMFLSVNHDWGFFGTTQRNYNFTDAQTARIFDSVGQMLKKKLGLPHEQIRSFLDGRYGRHFSDELSFHGAKEGMTEIEFAKTVQKYLDTIESRAKEHSSADWVIRECHKQEAYK